MYEGNYCTSRRTEVGWVESCVKILRQLLRNSLMDGLKMMNVVMPAIDFCMGLNSHWPPGMPKDACWRFPYIFWNLLSGSFCCFRIYLIILNILFLFWR